MGKPTLYKPEYCDAAIELGKRGKSVVAMACEFGVHRSVLYDWVEQHPDWKHAFEMAKQYAQVYWEEVGADGVADTKYFNAAVWAKIVGCRFTDYQDRNKVEVTGANGLPLQVSVNYNPIRANND